MTDQNLQAVADRFAAWNKGVEEKLPKQPERKKSFSNTSGIPVNRVYTPLDSPEENYLEHISFLAEQC